MKETTSDATYWQDWEDEKMADPKPMTGDEQEALWAILAAALAASEPDHAD